jgi:hypothetical protein
VKFLESVETATLKLAADPYRRSSVDYGLRYWPISRFPFVVFCDVRELEILVLGVMHTAQEPWLSQGSSHFLPIALAFLPIHACPCLQVLRRP